MAAGAVGGYFGARMAAAGHDVTFIARGAHRDAIRANGLIVESTLGNLHLKDAKTTDDPGDVGPVDIVLFAVKLWDTEAAAAQARPLIGPNTRLITFQNGVDSVERIVPILGADHIVGGSAYIATVIGRPGVVVHTSPFAKLRCGRIDGGADGALEAFSDAATKAGIDIETTREMNRVRWEKFTFLVALSGITASTREGMGVAMSDPDIKAMFRKMMAEVVAVARASGVNLTDGFLEEQFKFAEGVPPGMKASMAHDLERGNRLELDWLSGKVVELGRKFAIPVPANEAVYAILKPHRFGRTQ